MERFWLKEKRLLKGMTQKDVAIAVGIAVSTYSMYEKGNRNPTVSTACKLGKVLNCDWQNFFKEQLHEL